MEDNPLTPENDHAVEMYGKVATQFCYDLHMGPFVLESHGYVKGLTSTNELLERLTIIHTLRQQKKHTADDTAKKKSPDEFGQE
jgi:hypothetical protein